MVHLKDKPIRIDGINGIYSGRVMNSPNNTNVDFQTSCNSDINVVISELDAYVYAKLAEMIRLEDERLRFIATEEGKNAENIIKFLSHANRNFKQIEQIIWSWNNDMLVKFYEENDDDYVYYTGLGDPVWNDRSCDDKYTFLDKVRAEMLNVEKNLKIKFQGDIESLFYWDLPWYGSTPSDIDYDNERNLKRDKTLYFILNCELV